MTHTFIMPDIDRQIYVADQLKRLRKTVLSQALKRVMEDVDPKILRDQMTHFAPAAGLKRLQGTGVRDEEVFVVPCVLRKAPTLMGYYRLLIGTSQKQFYKTATGLNVFRSMEERGVISPAADDAIDDFCRSYDVIVSDLMLALGKDDLRDNVSELPLITLGAQLDGSWRTRIGVAATEMVFEALKVVVRDSKRKCKEDRNSISVVNAAGRRVTIELSADPDVVIKEYMGGNRSVYLAAIEIKGGTDYANIHNRVGEAEKSHQKAKADGAGQCWTVITLAGADIAKLHEESPSTSHWFDLAQVRARSGSNWDELVDRLRSAMGI